VTKTLKVDGIDSRESSRPASVEAVKREKVKVSKKKPEK
jgi:hypothetical protein